MDEHRLEEALIDVAGAAERLGVKAETIYAYVSRGLLRRVQSDDSRRSLLYAAEVEDLARRGKPRHRAGAFELAIESAVTALGPDRPYFRGIDALELAGRESFERVAEWLWSGTWLDAAVLPGLWRPREPGIAAARAAQAQLPPAAPPIDRLQVTISVLSATDPVRFQLDPAAVIATARRLIPNMVEALPPVTTSTRREPGNSIAHRLWPKLSPLPPSPKLVAALEAALVLLADHELAASTLAARVAASVRADPYAVVAAGLGVLVGPMHGGASLGVERLLRSIPTPASAASVLGEHLRRDERIPGIGHAVYKDGDARATRLLEILEAAAGGAERPAGARAKRRASAPTKGPAAVRVDQPAAARAERPAAGAARLAVSQAVVAELRSRRLPEINIDFAVATLVEVAGMIEGSGQAIFAIARAAGWLAHALEEYQARKPLRPRTIYSGPPIPARPHDR
jgi:citrate synthase